ncbi:hypothetical protein FEM48_Zijuj10G0067600 [Ziziphus jujuba var. spinosa]|uniref:Uncharacterized protein n=1 Tax=Ziziphus jujuba var. spinosa TaxID=714518 RepID=A0A978ULX5_ZIZJJ|nr:hypothetical protein FEM48_Zijuj10G0067600 [Ziziphus jujuba var. spinosa]
MASDSLRMLLLLLFIVILGSGPSLYALAQETNDEGEGIRQRVLLSFKETPRGTNATYECSPSGPCVPCIYSEKGVCKRLHLSGWSSGFGYTASVSRTHHLVFRFKSRTSAFMHLARNSILNLAQMSSGRALNIRSQTTAQNDEKYRCSETGYRIPLKCIEIKNGLKGGHEKTSQKGRSTLEISANNMKLHPVLHNLEELYTFIKHRRLLTEPSDQDNEGQAYTTYRSCIPAVNEEKLSVLGFEGIILCLLFISGSAVYYKRKRANATSGFGPGRIQTYARI